MNQITPNEISNEISNNKLAEYKHVEISESIYLLLSTGSQHLRITHSAFTKEVNVIVNKYGTAQIDFSESIFTERVSFIVDVSGVKINCSKATFENGFEVHSKFPIELVCSEATLQGKVEIEDCKFNNLDFEKTRNGKKYCTLQANKSVIKECNFNDSTLGEVYFENAIFEGNAKFDRCNFAMFNCSSAKFKSSLLLNNAEFYLSVQFNGAKFENTLIAPNLNKDDTKCWADFSGCTFISNTYFDFGNWDSFICTRSTFVSPVSFHLTKIRYVDFIGTFFQSNVDFSNTNYPESTTETFRIIKSELLKAQDRAGYLYYQSKELNQYEKTTVEWNKRPLEYFMLLLNRISTNHGVDWGRGVFFSLSVMIFFYVVYIITLPDRGFSWGYTDWGSFLEATDYVVKNFFIFIAIFRDSSFIEGTSPNAFSYFIDFIGRIFIGYGIYQTIQAFRKYGKT